MSIGRLRDFVCSMTRLVEARGNAEQEILEPARALMAGLVHSPNPTRRGTDNICCTATRWTGFPWSASSGALARKHRCTTI